MTLYRCVCQLAPRCLPFHLSLIAFPGLSAAAFIDSLVICILPQQEHAARSQLNIQIHKLLAWLHPPIRSDDCPVTSSLDLNRLKTRRWSAAFASRAHAFVRLPLSSDGFFEALNPAAISLPGAPSPHSPTALPGAGRAQ